MTPKNHTGFTDNIRRAAAEVAGMAKHVRLNGDKISAYTAALLQTRKPQMTALDNQTLGGGKTPEQKAAYALALDAVNFGSGYFELARESGVALEYAELALHLRAAFDNEGFDRPEAWAEVTHARCHDIFRIPAGAHARLDELMALFARHLNEAGQRIIADYAGQVMSLLETAGGSAERLAFLVGGWQGFADEMDYRGIAVPIYKRAQIFAADVWLSFGGTGAAAFHDMQNLTIFADNMVPHVLRHAGVLTYTPDLAARIDAGIEIAAGSEEEVELRAVSIHAVERMREVAATMGGHASVTAVNLDHILWNRGYEADLIDLPRHRTLTVFY
ncbi:MAG: hypothetical protein H3C49_09675 [Alphaproteobacteria bacterium]|nr:hypothetical protein [Alphaproteobacteria bacterium]